MSTIDPNGQQAPGATPVSPPGAQPQTPPSPVGWPPSQTSPPPTPSPWQQRPAPPPAGNNSPPPQMTPPTPPPPPWQQPPPVAGWAPQQSPQQPWPPPPNASQAFQPYAGYYAGSSPSSFRGLRGMMQATIALLILAGIMEPVLWAAIKSNDYAAILIFTVVGLGIRVGTWVVFSMWTYRAYSNMQSMSPGPTETTPGWAVGYFFIPIVNIYFPYRTFAELWRRSDPNPAIPDTGTASGLIACWWIAYLLMSVAGAGVNMPAFSQPGTKDIIAAVDVLLTLTAAGLGCLVVANLTARLHRRYDAFARTQLPPAPAPYY